MRSEHKVQLRPPQVDTVFGADWALAMVMSAYDHELYGPENFITRIAILDTLLAARLRISADRQYSALDRRSKKVPLQREWRER